MVGWGSPKVQFHDTRELSATGQTLLHGAQKELLCQGGVHQMWPGSAPYPTHCGANMGGEERAMGL